MMLFIGSVLLARLNKVKIIFSPPCLLWVRKNKFHRNRASKKCLFFLIFFLLIPDVLAQGIGVSPNKLEIETFKGETIERQITVFNPSDEKLDFAIKANDLFSFFPQESSINPHENQRVVVKIKSNKAGNFDEEINVMLKPKNNKGLAINLGTTVKVKIKSITRMNHLIGISVATSIVLLGLILVLLVKIKQTNASQANSSSFF